MYAYVMLFLKTLLREVIIINVWWWHVDHHYANFKFKCQRNKRKWDVER